MAQNHNVGHLPTKKRCISGNISSTDFPSRGDCFACRWRHPLPSKTVLVVWFVFSCCSYHAFSVSSLAHCSHLYCINNSHNTTKPSIKNPNHKASIVIITPQQSGCLSKQHGASSFSEMEAKPMYSGLDTQMTPVAHKSVGRQREDTRGKTHWVSSYGFPLHHKVVSQTGKKGLLSAPHGESKTFPGPWKDIRRHLCVNWDRHFTLYSSRQ